MTWRSMGGFCLAAPLRRNNATNLLLLVFDDRSQYFNLYITGDGYAK